MSDRTIFTDPAAVEAWDSWFRWREGGVLRDRTIEATWARLVSAVAHVERDDCDGWSQRWLRGLSRWQWLPDESLLRCAGTGATPHCTKPVAATLNAVAFVKLTGFGAASTRLDGEAIGDAAATALRFLDDALLAIPGLAEHGARIGMMGMADALASLGIEYDSPAALQVAKDAGAALAAGALRGAVELARERGGMEPARGRLHRLAEHGLSRALMEDALRWGVRHDTRTSIAPAARLALLANNASDALDPQQPRPLGASRNLPETPALPSPAAQLRLRSAIQPWIDEPIDYPPAIGSGQQGTPAVSGQTHPGPSAPAPPLHR